MGWSDARPKREKILVDDDWSRILDIQRVSHRAGRSSMVEKLAWLERAVDASCRWSSRQRGANLGAETASIFKPIEFPLVQEAG